MVSVIKGDIMASRKFLDQEKWLIPLKKLLGSWGKTPENWELVWGDFFQIEMANPEEALKKALEIKALIKKIQPVQESKKISTLDVRMAIGIGEKTYTGKRVSESNGPAFIHAGEQFDQLKKQGRSIGVKSPWPELDEELNLYLKLVDTFMDKWSISSAEIIEIALKNPGFTQTEIGKILGIKQSGVSLRWNRAHTDELLEVEKMFNKKIKSKLK
jgi:hypothetical protein